MKIITLTTDFGEEDAYVGAMKGVILRLCPRAILVDITHRIAPGDVQAGAFALAAAVPFFPRGTIHVAVVDPGVGSSRPALAVKTAQTILVGPDNGLLDLALRHQSSPRVHRLENAKYWLNPVSSTFHGRDIFAPVAAHVARGTPISRLGPRCRDWQLIQWPDPKRDADGLRGQVIALDHFGNAITNLPASWFQRHRGAHFNICAGRRRHIPWVSHYQAQPRGSPLALIGSTGFLEISVNGGSAARRLRLRRGSPVLALTGPLRA